MTKTKVAPFYLGHAVEEPGLFCFQTLAVLVSSHNFQIVPARLGRTLGLLCVAFCCICLFT